MEPGDEVEHESPRVKKPKWNDEEILIFVKSVLEHEGHKATPGLPRKRKFENIRDDLIAKGFKHVPVPTSLEQKFQSYEERAEKDSEDKSLPKLAAWQTLVIKTVRDEAIATGIWAPIAPIEPLKKRPADDTYQREEETCATENLKKIARTNPMYLTSASAFGAVTAPSSQLVKDVEWNDHQFSERDEAMARVTERDATMTSMFAAIKERDEAMSRITAERDEAMARMNAAIKERDEAAMRNSNRINRFRFKLSDSKAKLFLGCLEDVDDVSVEDALITHEHSLFRKLQGDVTGLPTEQNAKRLLEDHKVTGMEIGSREVPSTNSVNIAGMSDEQKLAIRMYTTQTIRFFEYINSVLNNEDRSLIGMSDISLFTKALLRGLQALAVAEDGKYLKRAHIAYRGMKIVNNDFLRRKVSVTMEEIATKFTIKQLSAASRRTSSSTDVVPYKVGEAITFTAFTSISLDAAIVQEFSDHLIFVFNDVVGLDISALSAYPNEKELLLPPPCVFQITALIPMPRKKLLMVHLKQVPPDASYLRFSSFPAVPHDHNLRQIFADESKRSDEDSDLFHDHDNDKRREKLRAALARGKKEWGRSKIMIVGEGRAGKTALANSIIGRAFEHTESTIGINQLSCDVKQVAVDSSAESGGNWEECSKPTNELQATLSRMIHAPEQARVLIPTPQVGASVVSPSAIPSQVATTSLSPAAGQSTSSSSNYDMLSGASSCFFEAPDLSASSNSLPLLSRNITIPEDMAMKCLAENISISSQSKLIISIYDFGGQPVFDVIHPFFLTSYGVYLLVFNMAWLLVEDVARKQSCLDYLKFWLNSVVVHTLNDQGKTAPIVLVGTNKDSIGDPSQHEYISTLLLQELSDSVAWRYILKYRPRVETGNEISLCFFPVDNTLGQQDLTMVVLLATIEKCIDESDYVREEKPLSWLQTFDKMTDTKKNCLQYDDVIKQAAECGVPAHEVADMLQFLFEMGMIMWHDEEGLRDVVIMDPVAYFVTPATLVICKHKESDGDPTRHFIDAHQECHNNYYKAFGRMVDKGIVSETLLRELLRDYDRHYGEIVQLMEKYSLLVPVKSLVVSTENDKEYVVPALLPESTPHIPWSDSCSSFAFVFSTQRSLEANEVLSPQILRSEGFLPSGLFERLIGKALLWSQQIGDSTYTLQLEQVSKNAAVLRYGGQRFCMRAVSQCNLIHVEVEGLNPIPVHQRLSDQINKLTSEIMVSLTFMTVLPLSRVDIMDVITASFQSLSFVSLTRVQRALAARYPLPIGPTRPLIQIAELKSMYGCWVQHDEVLPKYDVFLSYRWHKYDSAFTEALFDSFTLYSIGEPSRAIDVFRDKPRLKDGKDFQSEYCRALIQTSVVVTIVSVNTLEGMITHNPSKVDNVLVEWICGLLCYYMRDIAECCTRVRRIVPLVFGEKLADGSTIKSLFAPDGIRSKLPEVFPTASFSKAVSLLRENDIEIGPYNETDFTVAKICSRILAFQSSIEIGMLTVDQFANIVSQCPPKLLIVLREVLLEGPVIVTPPPIPQPEESHRFQAAFDIVSKSSNAKDPTSSTSLNQLMDDEGVSCATDLEVFTEEDVKKYARYLKTMQCRRFIIAMGYEL